MDSTSTTVDLTPLLQLAITFAVALLSALGAWAIKRVGDRLGLEADDKRRAYLNEALEKGLVFAAERGVAAGADLKRIDVRDRMVTAAIEYVLPKVPDALQKLKITPDDLRQMLEARLVSAAGTLRP